MVLTRPLLRLMRPRWMRWGVFAVGFLVATAVSFYGLLFTDWFQEQVRRRVIAEAEAATGGTVEIAQLRFDPDRLFVRAEGLVVRPAWLAAGRVTDPLFNPARQNGGADAGISDPAIVAER